MPLERERIGHYKVVKLAGEGGMGEVYVADDEHLPRRVAIKVISSAGASDSDVRRRFLREAHAAAALTHPNVAHIYDVGSDDGIDYIAMEYIEGETLAARLARGAMPIDEIVTVALQIADALAAAHERGVVHRDIKPSNVMLTTRGQVKVLDFGLATADSAVVSDNTRTDASATTPGMIIGTVNYMSPEQALGEPVTSSSDVFSVGVVLYEMLAGRKPFAGKTKADTLHRLTTREPDPLARYNYDLPVELERIVRKCMEKSAPLRYRSARELLVDLEALARDRSGSMAGRAPRWAAGSKRWTAKRMAIGLLILAAVVAIAALVGRAFRPAGFARDVHSIAVLPFSGASGELEYVGEGIADSLINSLGADRDTRVMARSTVFHYKDSPLTPQKIGHDLNVDAVVTVEMQRRGDMLSLAAELVSVEDGARLWGQRYERKFAEARAIEHDLAAGVRGALRMDHAPGPAAADPRRDEAHLLYLRGESEMNQRTADSIAAAFKDFRRAIDTDPGYAPPYAALADTITLSARYAEMPAAQLAVAREFARRALQLDPSLPEAHVAMASVFDTCDWNWAAAEQEYRKAIDMRPNGVLAHQWYALLLTRLGRRDEALREIGLALQLDPLSPYVHLTAANIDYYGHSFETAAASCAKSMEFDSVFPMTHVQMALIRIQQHRCAEARPELARGGTKPAAAVATRAALEACEGNTPAAEAALRELAARGADYEQAVAAAALQRNDLAIEMLKRGIDRRNVYAGYANVDPLLDSLHADPRFSALMRAAGVVR